jgi:hypothetical protein
MNQQTYEEARLAARLQALRAEMARGEAQLAELDQRRAGLRDTLLRISGAIQVLQELLDQQPASADLFPSAAETPPSSLPIDLPAGQAAGVH